MKDHAHHLKYVQKKVIQSVRKSELKKSTSKEQTNEVISSEVDDSLATPNEASGRKGLNAYVHRVGQRKGPR